MIIKSTLYNNKGLDNTNLFFNATKHTETNDKKIHLETTKRNVSDYLVTDLITENVPWTNQLRYSLKQQLVQQLQIYFWLVLLLLLLFGQMLYSVFLFLLEAIPNLSHEFGWIEFRWQRSTFPEHFENLVVGSSRSENNE